MNTRVRTKSHTMKSPLKHEKIVKSPSQMEKKEKIEKQGTSRLMEAERATTNKRCSSRERKMALLQDVDKLKKKLSHEESVHRALERAFNRPLGVLPRLPPYLPPSTLELLAEVAVLEEEVVRLEEQVVNYRKGLYEEAIYISSSKRNKENLSHVCYSQCKYPKKEQPNSLYQVDGNSVVHMVSLNRSISKTNVDQIGNCSNRFMSKINVDKIGNCSNRFMSKTNVDQIGNCSNRYINGRQFLKKPDSSSSLSENVRDKVNQPCIKSTKNKQTPNSQRSRMPLKRASMEHKAMENLLEPLKHELECRILDEETVRQNCLDISGEGPFQGETSSPNKTSEDLVKCLTTIFLRMVMNHGEDIKETDHQDPYGIYKEFKKREIGPYEDMYAIEANSIDTNLKATSWFLIQRLKVLLVELASVGLQGLTHQQKLAFWINIYNSCMMNAFLEHGIPESPQMVVALMQKAMINVGGQLLNAMTIEHFILRLPYNSKDIYLKDAKSNEIKARSIIGLEWSEPLVTFALSCGSWSSPAVRVYTASSIENELEAAKKDYLQAAITISTDNKLVIPKLLDWYLLDFAKDLQSFLDWICLQLPNDLRNEAISCLARGRKELLRQSVQVVPYEFSFRYLFHK